jgi:hypothetical protein
VSRKCGPQGRRHHSAWRRKSARLAVPFFSLPRLPGPAPGTTSVPARLRRRHVSKFRLGPTNLSTMFPSSGLRRTHLGAAVGATESVEHWFVIGTTVAPFLGPPTTRREVRIRAHKPSSACAITGPTSVDLASGPRWRTCVSPAASRRPSCRAVAEKSDSSAQRSSQDLRARSREAPSDSSRGGSLAQLQSYGRP